MRQLVIMAKVPRAGRVKTRLAKGIGSVGAVRFYRNALAATVRRLVHPRRWHTTLSVAPDVALPSDFYFASSTAVKLKPQGQGDLGARLQHVFRTAEPGPVVVIGSDIPAITPSLIADAFARLEGHDAVFGPSHDGGFWLIGLRAGVSRRGLFHGVRWSTSHALQDTCQAIRPASVAHIQALDDVDDLPSFQRLHEKSARIILPLI
ncbi:MAG: TIGR04282 family arsenosugar biosynthesis glycosyltransferase [Pseudomonadota bacterium]